MFIAAGIVAAITGLTLGIAGLFRMPPGTGRIQFNVPLEGMSTIATEMQNTHLAVSPDGSHLAFVTLSSGRRMLWLRARDGVSLQPLPGTENAASPFWSPDSQWIAFFADGKLKKIAASGGPVQELCSVPFGVGTGAWSRRGVILLGGESFTGPDGLYQVPDSGGEIALVVRPNSANARSAGSFGHTFSRMDAISCTLPRRTKVRQAKPFTRARSILASQSQSSRSTHERSMFRRAICCMSGMGR